MKAWVLMEFDYDDCWFVAAYTDEAQAKEHAERCPHGTYSIWAIDTDTVYSREESRAAQAECELWLQMSDFWRSELVRWREQEAIEAKEDAQA